MEKTMVLYQNDGSFQTSKGLIYYGKYGTIPKSYDTKLESMQYDYIVTK